MKLFKSPWFWMALIVLAAIGVIFYIRNEHAKELKAKQVEIDAERSKYKYNAVENANQAIIDTIASKTSRMMDMLAIVKASQDAQALQNKYIINQFNSLYGEIDKASVSGDSVAIISIITRLLADHRKQPVIRNR